MQHMDDPTKTKKEVSVRMILGYSHLAASFPAPWHRVCLLGFTEKASVTRADSFRCPDLLTPEPLQVRSELLCLDTRGHQRHEAFFSCSLLFSSFSVWERRGKYCCCAEDRSQNIKDDNRWCRPQPYEHLHGEDSNTPVESLPS